MSEFVYWYVRRPASRFVPWFASKMPRWLVYACAIRLIVNACDDKYPTQVVPELTAMDALKRWDEA